MIAAFRRQWPWSTEAGIRWLLSCVAFGAALVVITAHSGDKDTLGDQLPTLALAIAILMASASTHVSMTIRGRRAVSLRRQALLADGLATSRPESTRTSTSSDELVMVEGLRFHHRRGCSMVAGRAVVVVADGERHEPCGLCRPGATS